MAMRTVIDPYGGRSPLVDKAIGHSAYEVVRFVAQRIEYVKHVSAHMAQVYAVSGATEEIIAIGAKLAEIEVIFANLSRITQVATDINHVKTVSQNMPVINELFEQLAVLQALFANMARINTVANNMPALVNINTNMDALVELHGSLAVLIELHANLEDILQAATGEIFTEEEKDKLALLDPEVIEELGVDQGALSTRLMVIEQTLGLAVPTEPGQHFMVLRGTTPSAPGGTVVIPTPPAFADSGITPLSGINWDIQAISTQSGMWDVAHGEIAFGMAEDFSSFEGVAAANCPSHILGVPFVATIVYWVNAE